MFGSRVRPMFAVREVVSMRVDWILFVSVAASLATGRIGADDLRDSAVEDSPGVLDQIVDALVGGKPTLDLRIRMELVEQERTDTAQAFTERLRIGYGTKPVYGLSLYADFEDIRSADDRLYNAAGLNGEPDKAVVADPEDTELNQFLARFESEWVEAIAGRQRITLDDHRFVGNVGWRQNEQTFDAYTLRSNWIPDTTLFYSYIDDVNRVFGPDARRDFESNSHIVNASFKRWKPAQLTVFLYALEFPNARVNSSNSFGLKLTGALDFSSGTTLGYAASYAHQVDARKNPNDYRAHYAFFEGTIAKQDLGKLGVGYEVLSSDSGDFAFRTPLATLHKFNGWTDLFLVTPNDGLEDLYFLAELQLPWDIRSLAVYHLFFSESRSRDLGGEIDAQIMRKFGEHVSVLAKLAIFHSDSELPDTQKFWIQATVSF